MYMHILYPKACGRIYVKHVTVEIHEEEVDIVEKGMWLCRNGLWGILPTFIYCISFILTCFIFGIILVTKSMHARVKLFNSRFEDRLKSLVCAFVTTSLNLCTFIRKTSMKFFYQGLLAKMEV